MVRVTGIEPATSRVQAEYSTAELHPEILVEPEGIKPSPLRYKLSALSLSYGSMVLRKVEIPLPIAVRASTVCFRPLNPHVSV